MDIEKFSVNEVSIHILIPKFRISIKFCTIMLIENYYLIIVLLYLFTFKHLNFPVGFCSALVMCIVLFGLVISHGVKIKYPLANALVVFYVIYCISTVIFCYIEGLPIESFIKSVSNSLLPVCFFWCGVKGYYFSRKSFLLAINICGAVGVVLQFLRPAWFVQYCREYGYSYTRLSSCIGSIALGTLAAIAVVYSVQYIISTKGKCGKTAYLLSVAYVFLSFQRSAWVVVALTIAVLHYYVFLKWKVLKVRYLMIEILLVFCTFFIFQEYIIRLVTTYLAEHAAAGGREIFSGMFSGRTVQWLNGMKDSNLITGSGYGSRGHKAIGSAVAAIADGSWILLLCEIGIIGMSIFVAIIITTVKKGLHNLKMTLGSICVIAIILLQSIGSNILEFQITAPLLWMALGEIIANAGEMKKNESISDLSAPVS